MRVLYWVAMYMFSTGVQEYSIGSFAYNPGQMSGGKVPEYSTGFLCIYLGLYGRWEGPRVTFWIRMDISRALCQVRRS